MHRITNITITPEILKLIAEIDEFKGRWNVIETLAPEKLTTLRPPLRAWGRPPVSRGRSSAMRRFGVPGLKCASG
jgi:hypothetical protein